MKEAVALKVYPQYLRLGKWWAVAPGGSSRITNISTNSKIVKIKDFQRVDGQVFGP